MTGSAMRLEGCRTATWFETRSCAALLTLRLTSQHPITLLHLLRIEIHVAAHLPEFLRHLRHAVLDHARHRPPPSRRTVQRRGVVADVLRDLHRAELWAAHRAEMRHLVGFLRQRLVVEAFCRVRIEPEVELVD